MTLSEIKSCDRPFLLPADVAEVIGCDAHAIRIAAQRYPEKLGFHVSVMGTRTRIPRKAFLQWLGEDI